MHKRYLRDPRCTTRKVNLPCSYLFGHIYNLSTCCATNDAIVYEQDILALKLDFHRVELSSNRLFSCFLPRHDESPKYVAVFNECLRVRLLKSFRNAGGGGIGRLWNGNDNINVIQLFWSEESLDPFGKFVTHLFTAFLDGDSIDDSVSYDFKLVIANFMSETWTLTPGKIDILKYVWSIASLRWTNDWTFDQFASPFNDNGVPRKYIPNIRETSLIKRDRF